MLKNGYLNEDDILGKESYSIANGEIAEGTKIRIKKLSFGGVLLENVDASILHTMQAPLLLGQSAIGRLGKITIDPVNSTLTITQ
jgi:aspartyl protease family protein